MAQKCYIQGGCHLLLYYYYILIPHRTTTSDISTYPCLEFLSFPPEAFCNWASLSGVPKTDPLLYSLIGGLTGLKHIVILTLQTFSMKGFKAKSQREKGQEMMSRVNQAHVFKSPLPAVTEDMLNPSSNRVLIRDSAPKVFIGTWLCRHPQVPKYRCAKESRRSA